MEHLIKDPEKFFPFLNSFINEKFKESLLLIRKDLRFNKIHLDINFKKDTISEDRVFDSLKDFFESIGFTTKLFKEEDPNWKVYSLLKEEKYIGCFNSSILSNDDHDRVLISVSPIHY